MKRATKSIALILCVLLILSVSLITGCSAFENLFNGKQETATANATSANNGKVVIIGSASSQKASTSSTATTKPTATTRPLPNASPTKINGNTYILTFEEEFEGSSLDKGTWACETGTGWGTQAGWGWGNEEAEYYKAENAVVSDGTLKIIAKKEEVGGASYTSARINTKNSFSQVYGRFEARIKMPAEQGMWPAFWLLPVSNTYHQGGNTWPYNGEIDIMEVKGRFPTKTSCAVHSANGSGQDKYSSKWWEQAGFSVTDWHVYAVEWTSTKMDFYVDNTKIYTVNSSAWHGSYYSSYGSAAPFDKKFYIILNLAVGGKFDKEDGQNIVPRNDFVSATMEIDYVKVYQLT